MGDAISALDQGFTVTSNGANGKAIKAGDTLEIGTADGEKNLTVSKDGNSIKYGLNRNLDLDSVKAGNTTLNNAGVAVDDGTGNVSKLTTAGTTVADSAGNNASYGAKEASLKDSAGNTNTSTATGNTVADSAGNSTATTAAGTNVADKNGNSNSLTATGNTLADKDGNNTVTTASGTNVTDKDGNSNNLTATGNTLKDNAGNNTTSTASGVTVADGSGNSTAVTATGVSVSGGPSLTKTGLDLAGGTLTNLKGGDITAGSTDAVTGGQVAEVQSQLQKQLGSVGDSAVQYAKNSDGTINYASIVAGNGNTTATIENGKVTSGGTTISNLANGVNASDAVNKGQLDTLSTSLSSSLTSVVAGNGQTFNLTDQIVNRNIDSSNENSSFKTYDKMGQTMTDEATLAQTVKKMNMDGIKYSHTNGDTTRVNGLTNDSSAGGVYSTAIGINAIINENARNAVALGVNTSAGTDAANSVVIGNNSSVSGTSSVAIGDGATASGTQSISIGT
ncbi:Head domain of trimeric autotransporter adhesin, partial [Acinetobacter boissieri]